MRRRTLALALAIGNLASIPVAQAQRFDQSMGVRRLALVEPQEVAMNRLGLHLTSRSGSAVCDGSEVRDVESKQQLGTWMFYGGMAAIALYPAFVQTPQPALATTVVLGGTFTSVFGYRMRNSTIDPESLDRALQTFKVGQTKADDVLNCLGKPKVSTTDGNESAWTYNAVKPGLFSGASARMVTVTIKNGIVTGIRNTTASM